MNKQKRHLRKLTKKCNGYNKEFPRSRYDDHILDKYDLLSVINVTVLENKNRFFRHDFRRV